MRTPTLHLIIFTASVVAASAQTLPSYTIYRAPSPIKIDGKLNDPAWRHAPIADDFHFNWWTSGEKEKTEVRMLWDDQYLYVAFHCYDKHISAKVTEHQGPVSNEDAIEFYASPHPDKLDFDGFEINALGTWLAFRIEAGKEQVRWEPEGLLCRTSLYPLHAKEPSPRDRHWIVELAFPWKTFSELAVHTPPQDGDRWRVNLNRIDLSGDERQYSSWSPIPASGHGFAVPEAFGWVTYVNKPPK